MVLTASCFSCHSNPATSRGGGGGWTLICGLGTHVKTIFYSGWSHRLHVSTTPGLLWGKNPDSSTCMAAWYIIV